MWGLMKPAEKGDAIRAAVAAGCVSAAEIAARLHTTRDAVIGAAHRNDITLKGIGGPKPKAEENGQRVG